MITVCENKLTPVYKILNCKPEDIGKFPNQYILQKIKEYYSAK